MTMSYDAFACAGGRRVHDTANFPPADPNMELVGEGRLWEGWFQNHFDPRIRFHATPAPYQYPLLNARNRYSNSSQASLRHGNQGIKVPTKTSHDFTCKMPIWTPPTQTEEGEDEPPIQVTPNTPSIPRSSKISFSNNGHNFGHLATNPPLLQQPFQLPLP